MAGVPVISPEGERGEVPEESLQAALQRGFQLDEGGPAPAPAAAPAEPRMVRVRSPEGDEGMVPETSLSAALERGFTDLDADERYGSVGQRALTAAEGGARGASLGASDAIEAGGANIGTQIGHWLADAAGMGVPRAADRGIDAPLMDDVDLAAERSKEGLQAQSEAYGDIQGRREANPVLAATSEIAGAAVPALASGGVGSVGAAARLTPAGQLANLATKMGTTLSARAATGIGRIGALAATGAAEAAVDATTRRVMDDLAAGNVDITAERMLESAWDGARMGALLGGGLGALAEGGQALARGARSAAEGLSGKLPSVEDFASGRAFKAALGRTSKRGVDQSMRFGGPEAVGKTLLREGVVTADASLDDIAERAGALRQKLGAELGSMVKQADDLSGGAGPSRAGLRDAIESRVLSQLDEGTFSEGTAATVRGKFKKLFGKLEGDAPLSFEEIHGIRRELDDELANWNKLTGEQGPLKAYRDTRRVMEDYYLESAEAAAQKAGRPGFVDVVNDLKRRYSHVALADDLANEAIKSRLSNRFMSPSDYGMGAAAAVVTGGTSLGALASGAVASQANRIIRERGNQVVAGTLYRLARGAVKNEKSIEQTVEATMQSLTPQAARVVPMAVRAATRAAIPAATVQRMVAQAQALQDPESPESHQLEAMTLQMAGESPEMADALKAAVMRKATMIVQRMGPATDPSDPLQRQPMPMDRVRRAANERFMIAVADPRAALDRLGSGSGSPEDLAVVRELIPNVHKRWADGVLERVVGGKVPLSASQRNRLLFALGRPVVREQTPEYVQMYQNMWRKSRAGQQQQAQQAQQPNTPPNNTRDFDIDAKHFAARSDQVMDIGGVE